MKTPYFKSISKVVNIQENPTAGTVIAKLWKRSQIDFDVIRRVSITSTSDYAQMQQASNGIHIEFDEDVTEQFLYEVGGNIGEYNLPHSWKYLLDL